MNPRGTFMNDPSGNDASSLPGYFGDDSNESYELRAPAVTLAAKSLIGMWG